MNKIGFYKFRHKQIESSRSFLRESVNDSSSSISKFCSKTISKTLAELPILGYITELLGYIDQRTLNTIKFSYIAALRVIKYISHHLILKK